MIKVLESPFVSIIIPYYKNIGTISRAVQSVIDQTEKSWELIVVDDGSNDELETIIKSFEPEKITLIKKPNSGPSDSRNRGAKLATGKFLAFLDSDDWLSPDWLENFKKKHQENGFDIAFCYGALIDEETGEREDWTKFVKLKIHGEEAKFNNLVGTFLVRSSIFENARAFDPNLRYSENMDLAIRIMRLVPPSKRFYLEEVMVFFDNTIEPKKRNQKYGRALLLKDLAYFQQKHKQVLLENTSFLRAIIRRQLVSATVCWNWKIYILKLKELYSYSVGDGLKFTLLFFFLPFNRMRLLSHGFRK